MSAHATSHLMRWAHVILLIVLAVTTNPAPVATAQEVPELQINSAAYIVIDADTGEIFAQKNARQRRAMASLTKVFTLIEALKRAPLNLQITTQVDDLYDENSSLMGFGPDETFTLEELLYGLMLPSGNDAAHAVARALGTQPGDTGDEGYERFIGWLNERVQMMGLQDTQLINPHGWGVPGHYTTGYDLAAFVRYALNEPEFVKIFGTETYITSNGYELRNNNRLMYSYSELIGGKTGYDWDAGYCLIAVAQRNGHTAISVTFDGVAPDDWYDDNRVLLDYALDQMDAAGGDRELQGDVVTYTSPELNLLSQARSTSALAGADLQIAAGDDASGPDSAQSPGESPATSSSEAESAKQGSPEAPGPGLPLAVALAVVAAFIVLAGRGFSIDDASLGRALRSFAPIGKIPRPKRPAILDRIRNSSEKLPDETPND